MLHHRRIPHDFHRLAIVPGILAVVIASAMTHAVPAAGDSSLAQWVELGPGGVAIARVVVSAPSCPPITLDGQTAAMQVRAQPSQDFPVLVCELTLPDLTKSASLLGQSLALPRSDPQRLVVLGDRGCRIKMGDPTQACNDTLMWPALQVAQSAAAAEPDLVLYVGDFVYREAPCPASIPGCSGSPYGDNWAAWNADVFTPSASLLQAAPWVVLRGDHETCDRGGEGWFRFFDPRPMPASCQDYTDPYSLPAGKQQLIVFDDASASDASDADTHKSQGSDVQAQLATYASQYATVRSMAAGNSWLLQHQPLWGVRKLDTSVDPPKVTTTNDLMQQASDNDLPAAVQLVLSGHIHFWEDVSFTDGRPPQLVVGNGGTLLETDIRSPLAQIHDAGAAIAAGQVIHQWGFMTMDATAGGWTMVSRDADGSPLLQCLLRGSQLTCHL